MGSPGPPDGFDIQNFFKAAPQSAIPGFNPSNPYPPNHPFHPSSLPFPPSNFPSSNSYPSSTGTFSSLPGSYSFPSQGSVYHSYTQYSQDQLSRSSPHPPAVFSQPRFSQPVPCPVPSLTYSAASLSQLNLQSPISSPPLDGARLMALLTTHSSGDLVMKDDPSKVSLLAPSSTFGLPPPALYISENFQGSSQVSNPPAAIAPAVPSAPPVSLAPPSSSTRLSSSKLPRGRHLKGEYVVYDTDVRLPGEAQPQLEVSPIAVYGSDPVLVVGRQIAVNKSYICYGLRAGTIRILNINTALKALLRGHSQRITDMAFLAEDVHLLASASSDGRVFVRRIIEEEGKMQITEQIILAIHILGDWESAHPRVCWHSQLQDLLVVGIGKYILTIDIPKARLAAPPTGFTAEDLLICFVASPIEGIHCVVGHDADVTDLSTSQWTWLASASKDGMVRIWGDKKMLPISSLNPHEGHPVGSVAFLSAPLHPDHTVLLTAGQLNREFKLWVPAGGEGWFSLSGNVKWQCIQTLELRSSAEGKLEDAFFNQVLVVPRACLLLLANAKKNAIYAVHIDFGLNPFATRMDYLAEFSVIMPILSLTATSENVSNGEGVMQVYCVQTQAIQQYALDLSQCLPPAVGEPLLTSAYNLEQDLISGSPVPDRSRSTTPPPIESALVGGGSKSPEIGARARSPGPLAGVTKNSFFSSALELPGSRDQMAATVMGSIAMIESKSVIAAANKEVREILNRENVPSLPKIVAPAPHIGSGPVSPLGSPLGRSSKSPILSSSPREQADRRLQLHELPAERKVEDSSKIDSMPLSPQRLYDESIRKDSGRESPILHTSSLIAEQQVDSGPVHLITPSELMSMVARSKAEVDGELSTSPRSAVLPMDSSKSECKPEERTTEIENLKMEAKEVVESNVAPSEDTGVEKETIIDSTSIVSGITDKSQTVASSDSGFPRESDSMQTIFSEQRSEVERDEEGDVSEERDSLVNIQGDEVQEQLKEMTTKGIDSPSVPIVSQSPTVVKGRKNKNKTNVTSVGAQATTMSSSVQVSSTTVLNATTFEGESSNGNPASTSSSNLAAHILAMQDSLIRLVTMQKELQKQIAVMVAAPVSKEGKRIEAALGQQMEKQLKAHVDAMWARIQEENAKREKLERERVQQLTTLLSNSMNKDLPASLERVLKKEISSISPAIGRLITPNIEKAIPIAVNEAFQKGINEKGIMQLEKSIGTKLEATLLRQIQSHFQTTGRQALQEALRSCFEGSVIPAFERSCRAMFEQVDAAFKSGMAEHATHAHQQFAASHSVLASTLQDTVASASSLAASLKGELADGQRKLLALAESAGSVRLLSGSKQSNGGLPDKVVTVQDVESRYPTIELSRLVGERRLEEAFNKALSLSDVTVVSWLCNQIDPGVLFTTSPLPLSQGVLLSLVQQLSCDLGKDITKKLTWIQDAALALNPNDPVLAPHMRPILEQLYQNLRHQMLLTNLSGEVANSMRLVIHVVNSLLTTCK